MKRYSTRVSVRQVKEQHSETKRLVKQKKENRNNGVLALSSTANGCNIGWAEMIAIELGLLFAIHQGFSDTHFVVNSDNQGVIHALEGGKSRSPEQNTVLQWITSLLARYKIWISSNYVPSIDNLADLPSRGLPVPDYTRTVSTFTVPPSLSPFLIRPDH